jgi:hypothetical protein
MEKTMEHYLEQTARWLPNPTEPDKRKRGRNKRRPPKLFFPAGTHWIYDDESGVMYGEGVSFTGPQADEIRAHCKEVEPGFGVLVHQENYGYIFAELIDAEKITISDIQGVLKIMDNEFEEESTHSTRLEKELLYNQSVLRIQEYNYRHWLSLDPPDKTLADNVAESEKRVATLKEYEANTKRQK